MCGIAGAVLHRPDPGFEWEPRLARMQAAMRHRGPDDEGLYVAPERDAGLVASRLAIRDLSPAGHMPMSNAAASVWISYNGELYNADELRAELVAHGYRFRSGSDTEVVLHGYEAWGEGVLERLRGMFAFAILDRSVRDATGLLLARDRLGIKPLYYAQVPQGLVFASELRALDACGLVSGDVDPAAIVAYLSLGSVPAPLTIRAGVHMLEPGRFLRFDARPGSAPRIERYWSVMPRESAREAADPTASVRALLEDAVRTHLVSDVPLGAFLSGGLDSSAVVALMRAVGAETIRTCSLVFDEPDIDESEYSRVAARALGTEHFERRISARVVLDELDDIFAAMDQPTIDGLNTYFISQTARQAGLTVALSGLGGDELFGGYAETFAGVPRVMRALRVAQAVPAGAHVARAAMRMLPTGSRWGKVSDALARAPTRASAYLVCRGLFSPGQVRQLVRPDVWEAAAGRFDPVHEIAAAHGAAEPHEGGRGWDDFVWVSGLELRNYTHHQLLRDTDVMSMRHSLEVRVPLLDDRLVEGVMRLPAAAKLGATPKALFAAAVRDLLPPAILARRAKKGFIFPLDAWLRGPLAGRAREAEEGLGEWLRPAAVARVRRMQAEGKLHWSRSWALVALHGWRAA